MQLPLFIHRYYLHFLRYRIEFVLSALFVAMISLLFGLIYPGEEGTASYVEVVSLIFGELVQTVENPGYYFWILFGNMIAFQIYIPLFSIFIGVKVLPFREKDGKELLFTTSKSNIMFFIENSILICILICLICFPGYFISVILLLLNTEMGGISSITTLFIIILSLSLIFAFLSSLGSSLTFSKTGGFFVSGLYLIFNFLIGNVPLAEELDFLKDFSLTFRAEIFINSAEANIPFDFIFLSMIIISILILGSIILLFRKDFIGIHSPTRIKIVNMEGNLTNKLSFIHKPLNKLLSIIGWRFPIIRDQFQANIGFITIYLIVIAGIMIYVIGMWGSIDASDFGNLIFPIIQNPLFKGALYGHQKSIDLSLDSFLAYEVFGFSWFYYAAFLILMANDIINRDYKNDYVEITYIFPYSRSKIILQRTIASIFILHIIFCVHLITTIGMETLTGEYSNFNNLVTAFIAMDWAYTTIFIFFIAILILFPSKHGLKVILIVFVLSVIVIFVAFILDIAILLYMTPFGYFDLVGPILGDLTLIDIIPKAILFTCVSVIFYILVMKFRLPNKDLL